MKSTRIISLVLGLLTAAAAFAQTPTQKSRADLYTEAGTLFSDVGADPITPEQLRTSIYNIVASSYNPLTDGAAIAAATVNGYFADPSTNASFSASAWRTDLGGTTVGIGLFTASNPSAIRFIRINADNSVSLLDSSTFLSAIGGGASTWGAISGTLSNQTDLQSALDAKQALDSDLTYLAGFTPTANVKSVLNAADYAAIRTLLGLVIGTNVQAYDADLTTYAGITPAANVQSLLGAANYAAMRGLLDLEAGTDFLAYPSGTPTGSKYLRDDNSWQPITGGGDALVANPLTQFSGITPSNTEFNYVDGVTSPIQDQLDAKQALDSDLTYLAGFTPTANVKSVLNAADYAAIRTLLGLVIGTNVQAYDADLDYLAGFTPTANVKSVLNAADYAAIRTLLGLVIGTNVQAYDADLTTYAGITPSANIQSLLGSADYAAARTNLGLAIGTNVQAYDADLTTYAGITPSANIQSLLGSADYAAARTNLGLAIGTNVQAYDADLTTYAGITPAANVQSLLGAANYAAIRALLDLESGTDFLAYPSGTPTGSKFLRDDNTWATPSGTGTVTATAGSLTDNTLVLGAGGTDTKVVPSLTADVTTGALTSTSTTTSAPLFANQVSVAGTMVHLGFANTSTNSAARSQSWLAGNAASANASLVADVFGTAFTTSGTNIQDAAALSAGSLLGGGLVIRTRTTAPLRFAINDTDRGGFNSSGAFDLGGVSVVTISSTDTLTNKTLDASATGNVLKTKGYVYLTHPHLADGTNATIGTTATAIGYGHATFSNSVDKATNYVEYFIQVPEDLDTSVALRARLKVLLGGTDTGSQRYVLSSVSVADSAVPGSATLANEINLDFAGDGSGASGDVETSAWTTLTSWAGALTAGQTWRIRLARDGDTSDTSTVNSTELGLVIEYGTTQ